MIAPNRPTLEQISREFVTLLPELSGRLSIRFRFRDPEAQDDLVAEGIGLAWMMFLSTRLRENEVTVGNLAFYAGRAAAAGRKVAGTTSLDALSDTATARERIQPHVSLNDLAPSQGSFYMTFGDKRWRWPIVDYVAPHLDMEAFQASCRPRDRQIMKLKASGCPQTDIAAKVGISPPAVCQRLRHLQRKYEAMTAA